MKKRSILRGAAPDSSFTMYVGGGIPLQTPNHLSDVLAPADSPGRKISSFIRAMAWELSCAIDGSDPKRLITASRDLEKLLKLSELSGAFYLHKGHSVAQVAKIVGFERQTIYGQLKALGFTPQDIHQTNDIRMLLLKREKEPWVSRVLRTSRHYWEVDGDPG